MISDINLLYIYTQNHYFVRHFVFYHIYKAISVIVSFRWLQRLYKIIQTKLTIVYRLRRLTRTFYISSPFLSNYCELKRDAWLMFQMK